MKDPSERLADGDYDAADYRRNDPYERPTTAADWGEDWEAYDQAHQRAKQEQAERERWALVEGQ